jgi:uncharacterized protein (TIGR02453 family)
MEAPATFRPSLVRFLGQLKRNNNRPWFERNKARYEAEVRQPVLAFIRAIGPLIEAISPRIFVSDLKSGGSMMRPYRDTRFGGSKLPYKTNVGIHFRHEYGEDAHAPGFWMHIEPGDFWLALGMWRPDSAALAKVRTRIAEAPEEWLAARDDAGLRAIWQIVGHSLKRPPRGFDPNHPLIDDIKRTEFLGFKQMRMADLYSRDVVKLVADAYAESSPFMRFLCGALGMRF